MGELAYYVALLSPLFALAAAVSVFLKRRGKKNAGAYRSLGLYALGFLVVGVLFFVVGFLVGSHISCKGAKYAECVLGGVLIGGPLGFTIATSVYLYFWGKNGKAP
jgi:hypothetical protein